MLVRLRVRGFKNLHDLEVHFGPFTCVAGPNGVGKSNLFDAIRFLNLLTSHSIMEAVQRLRETKGRSPDPKNLFTTFEGYRAEEIRFTADMIVSGEVQDDLGVTAHASTSKLRYEVAFRQAERQGIEHLELAYESLDSMSEPDMRTAVSGWSKPEFRKSCITGRSGPAFISTEEKEEGPLISVRQEGHGGRKTKVLAPKSSKTVIGGLASSDFPTILAVHREMESWQTLMLEPSAMRAPSNYRDSRFIDSRGANLPAAIERLRRLEAIPDGTTTEIANKLSELIDDIQQVHVRDDPKSESWTIEVRGRNGIFHPARSLSDGTLRFLVLATFALDPEGKGIICLEEPENGIHPERVPAMVGLLRDIAVDAEEPVGTENPLRQVVINTHSPKVIDSIRRDELIYLGEVKHFFGRTAARVAEIRPPKNSWRAEQAGPNTRSTLSRGQMKAYLDRPKVQLELDY